MSDKKEYNKINEGDIEKYVNLSKNEKRKYYFEVEKAEEIYKLKIVNGKCILTKFIEKEESIKQAYIPDGITIIGNKAFNDNKNVDSVIIQTPYVKKIGSYN